MTGTERREQLIGVGRRVFAERGVAVHVLPAVADVEGNPSLEWRLFAGHSAALFATLAGVSVEYYSRLERGTIAGASSTRSGVVAM